MGAARTSNKDIANKLDTLIDLMTAAAQAPVVTPPVATPTVAIESAPKVDAKYLAHMNVKAAAHATKQGVETVLYSRKNKSGQVKLAYALRPRFDASLKSQPSTLGVVGTYQP